MVAEQTSSLFTIVGFLSWPLMDKYDESYHIFKFANIYLKIMQHGYKYAYYIIHYQIMT